MSEPLEEEQNPKYFPLLIPISSPKSKLILTSPPPYTQPIVESVMMMDLDLDLDGSWSSDQIFTSDPTSPFLLSDQPWSPLWAFSDDNDAGNVARPVRSSDYPKLLPPCALVVPQLLISFIYLVIHYDSEPNQFGVNYNITLFMLDFFGRVWIFTSI